MFRKIISLLFVFTLLSAQSPRIINEQSNYKGLVIMQCAAGVFDCDRLMDGIEDIFVKGKYKIIRLPTKTSFFRKGIWLSPDNKVTRLISKVLESGKIEAHIENTKISNSNDPELYIVIGNI